MFEIGSDFSEGSTKSGTNRYINLIDSEKRYVLSGRTAITHIVEDILSYSKFRRVALPEYCCASMIIPFYSKGIEVLFYSSHSKYEELFDNVEAVLVMDYFGIESDYTLKIAKTCKIKDKLLIVDATQTAFSRLETYNWADYILVSYRKWTDCLCAAVYSKRGFVIKSPKQSNDEYIKSWRKASNMKKEYLLYNQGTKIEFLKLYKIANRLLSEKYNECVAPSNEIEKFETIDSDYLRMSRRSNAAVLMRKIREIIYPKRNDIQFMYKRMNKEDCPLFVPILIEAKRRDEIRQRLIDRTIYCPVHWPIDRRYPYTETRFHENEISLICDQRYDERDMLREVDEVKQAIGNV